MFLPSDKALNHFSNALYRLAGWPPFWFELLAEYGFADLGELPDVMGDPELEAATFSWQSLKGRLDNAKQENPEQLRNLCCNILRKKDEYGSKAKDSAGFSDSIAQFEVELEQAGYAFDGFEILSKRAVPSIGQLADEVFEKFLQSPPPIPTRNEVSAHLSKSRHYLSEENYTECLTNLRLTLKYTLEGIAKRIAELKRQALPSEKEPAVRDYLKAIGFLSEEEWRGFWGIYGLLSAGPHGKSDRTSALLSYGACVMACHYAAEKFKDWESKDG